MAPVVAPSRFVAACLVSLAWLASCADTTTQPPPATPTAEPPPGAMLGDSPADAVAARPPATTSASATKAGQLDPAVIQAVLRQESKRFRRCYEQGRARKSDLVGKVVTRFVIDVDGHVASASDAESTIADDKVVECVVARVRKLQFPRPEGGKVQVVYPIRFEEAL